MKIIKSQAKSEDEVVVARGMKRYVAEYMARCMNVNKFLTKKRYYFRVEREDYSPRKV